MLGVWGIESAYGDPLVQQNHMRPIIPSLAALAWGEPRRRTYWEQELINALVHRRARLGQAGRNERLLGRRDGPHPVDAGSLAAHVGSDYDGDGRVSPFGKPDDALGSTAKYLVSAASIATASTGATR